LRVNPRLLFLVIIDIHWYLFQLLIHILVSRILAHEGLLCGDEGFAAIAPLAR
jgi:hypothetical protein